MSKNCAEWLISDLAILMAGHVSVPFYPTLRPYERVRKVVIMREPWTVENSRMTPTLKLRRGVIEQAVEPQLPGWYDRPEAVLWEEEC